MMWRFASERGMREEPKRSKSIVQRDDHSAFFRERRAIVSFLAPETRPETAAVDPDQYRSSRRAPVQRIRPDVEIKTIFRNTGGERIDVVVRLVLNAVVTQLASVANTRPMRGRLRRTPAQLTDGRRSVRNSAKDHHACRRIGNALERARVDSDAWGGIAMRAEESRQRGRAEQREAKEWAHHVKTMRGK